MGGRGSGRGTGGKCRRRGNHRYRCGGLSGATKKKGMCEALGEHMFNYNEKGAADQEYSQTDCQPHWYHLWERHQK